MENDSNSQQEKYDFGNIKIARKMLNEFGYLLNDVFFPGTFYHVYPMGREENYPLVSDGKTPRSVGIVDSKGKLFIKKPYDDDPILIRHQEELEELVSQLSFD